MNYLFLIALNIRKGLRYYDLTHLTKIDMNPLVERQGDLILSQGTFVFVQDGASGQVEVIVGPHKVSLADTDKPVIFDPYSKRFVKSNAVDAVQTFITADEEQYIVLSNPVKDSNQQKYPSKGKQQSTELNIGNKIYLNGPANFALFPGQYAEVIDGHRLKSNEYLLVRVYNEEAAKINYDNAVVKKSEESKDFSIKKEQLVTGNLFIIKGIEVSFYIPPTGIEVVPLADGSFVRNAITLERLEYCILLDQNGDKRYVEGPAVVFPKPTETFITSENQSKFKAIELNDNMGLYIKVIAEYSENNKLYKAGEELFITGKEQKIYFPRPEHAIIKYGNTMMHYATAIPEGEGRYLLNKNTGEVKLVEGPKMLLADPRYEVQIRRVLSIREVQLWFPGNNEALEYNKKLLSKQSTEPTSENTTDALQHPKNKVVLGPIADELQRNEKFTKPRMITLDTKFEGAVSFNIWPGYAIQIVKKSGDRKVVKGPKSILLEYDETLETLELSTGKPKSDSTTLKTVYLQTENNVVSDLIEVETKDAVIASIRLAYRVNFKDEHSGKWFHVSNYVKLLTQHACSLIRNAVKKMTIEEFNASAADSIRDVVLGKSAGDGKRPGRLFEENGMFVYDVEILHVSIGDLEISDLLKQAQHDTVQHNLELLRKEKSLEFIKKSESLLQEELKEKAKTAEIRASIYVQEIEAVSKAAMVKLKNEEGQQSVLDAIKEAELERLNKEQTLTSKYKAIETELEIKRIKESMSSVSPGLIEAITTLSTVSLSEILAKNLKIQTGGLGGIFPKGGIEGVLETIKGTPLERSLSDLLANKNQTIDIKEQE